MASQPTQSKAQLVLGFLVLGLLFFGAYWVISRVWDALSSAQAIGAGIVAATLTGAVAIATTFINKHLDRKAQVVFQLREKKVPIYENIIQLVYDFALAGKAGRTKLSKEESLQRMATITEQLTIWGSDDLLKEYHRFRMSAIRQGSTKEKTAPLETLRSVADLMLAVRKDLGHQNKEVDRRTVLGLFVNDLPKNYK